MGFLHCPCQTCAQLSREDCGGASSSETPQKGFQVLAPITNPWAGLATPQGSGMLNWVCKGIQSFPPFTICVTSCIKDGGPESGHQSLHGCFFLSRAALGSPRRPLGVGASLLFCVCTSGPGGCWMQAWLRGARLSLFMEHLPTLGPRLTSFNLLLAPRHPVHFTGENADSLNPCSRPHGPQEETGLCKFSGHLRPLN